MASKRRFAWKSWLASIVLAGLVTAAGVLFGSKEPFNHLREPAFRIMPYFPKSILQNFALALSLLPVVNFVVYLIVFRLFFGLLSVGFRRREKRV